jgi:hypothetical protein
LQTPEQGADGIAFTAISSKFEDEGGLFFANCKENSVNSLAKDAAVQKKLWDVSCELTGWVDSVVKSEEKPSDSTPVVIENKVEKKAKKKISRKESRNETAKFQQIPVHLPDIVISPTASVKSSSLSVLKSFPEVRIDRTVFKLPNDEDTAKSNSHEETEGNPNNSESVSIDGAQEEGLIEDTDSSAASTLKDEPVGIDPDNLESIKIDIHDIPIESDCQETPVEIIATSTAEKSSEDIPSSTNDTNEAILDSTVEETQQELLNINLQPESGSPPTLTA